VSKKLTILIVDDDLTNRLVLRALVNDAGYQCIEVEDGQQAVDAFNEQDIDIILLDVMMPVMDGYEAAKIIKKNKKSFVPIIFLTAMTDENALAECIEAGGDDFLTKPYNHVILKSKIESMIRIRRLYQKIEAQHAELSKHHTQTQQEMSVAKKVFKGLIHHDMKNESTGLRFSMSPMSMFNGDVILAERNHTSGLNILISDFTGHGLSASLGSIPTADIFYTMTQKGFSYKEILTEISNKLQRLLPTQMFMACALISVDRENSIVTVANCGIPDLYLVRNGEIINTFSSNNIPLGIVKQKSENLKIEMSSIEYGDRIFAATDGIMEAENSSGEMYGLERLLESFNEVKKPEYLFDKVLNDCLKFCGGAEQSDDVTLLELHHKETVDYGEDEDSLIEVEPSNWEMQFDMDINSLRKLDLLPYVMQGIEGLRSIPNGHSILYTILTEIYANSLDHGVLGLDSAIKNSPEGYMEFYQEKTNRLEKQKEGNIKIDIKHEIKEGGGGKLTIHAVDSGEGFDYENKKSVAMEENECFSGRGLSLLRQLCKEVKHLGKGNEVVAVYEWG